MTSAREAPPSRDVGLGTAYERVAVTRLLLRWAPAAPATALEGPVDGMAGMPGLHLLPLARRGTRVTLAHPSPEVLERARIVYERAGLSRSLTTICTEVPPAGPFELALVFNAACAGSEWQAYLSAVARVARRVVVLVSHRGTWGAWVRRGLRAVRRQPRAELFDHPAARVDLMESHLARLGRIESRAFVDCPWWPDLFVRAGDTLASDLLRRSRLRARAPAPQRVYGPRETPFALEDEPREIVRALRHHPVFDQTAWAPVFAHHRAWVIEVEMD